MIPVEQRYMAVFDEHGDNVQRGDCLTACVASLFELPIEDVPFFVDSDRWWNAYQEFIHARGFQLGTVRISTDDGDPLRLAGHPTEGIYWIATVKSPRGLTRCAICRGVEQVDGKTCECCNGTGLEPSLHSMVMCGGESVWDPHPQREMGHLGWVSGEWFIARDPARLVLFDAPTRNDAPLPEDLERLLRDPELAVPQDRAAHELLRKHARQNPGARVTRDAYLNLWALFDLETRG